MNRQANAPLFVLLLAGLAAFPSPAADPALRVASDLVLAPVTVTDRDGALISGLTPSQFRILDDGEPRPILSFEKSEVPMSVVLVLDTSASMGSKIVRAHAALRSMVDVTGSEDDAALLTFSDHPQFRGGFTRDIDSLLGRLAFDRLAGATALIDAIWQSLEVARHGRNSRKAIIVISDGGDNHSQHTASELMNAARETDAQIYGIAIHEELLSAAERSGSDLLDRLAQATGGLRFEVRSSTELPAAAERISRAIRDLYVIGFKPSDGCDEPRWHKIRVRLEDSAPRHWRVSAKSAYFRGDPR